MISNELKVYGVFLSTEVKIDLQIVPLLSDLENHNLFCDIDWEHQLDRKMPFIPCPDNATDTSYFDGNWLNFSLVKISVYYLKQYAVVTIHSRYSQL